MKYSFEEKLAAVKYYLTFHSYRFPADVKTLEDKKTYRKNVKSWVAKYIASGEEGLRHKGMTLHSAEEKLAIIGPCMRHELTFGEQQKRTGILTGTIAAWIKAYCRYGIQGLEYKPGRKPKSMPEDKQDKKADSGAGEATQTEKDKSLKEQLDDANRRILYLQFENDLLKKVKALEKEERSRRSGRKQSTHSSKVRNTKAK